MKKISSTIVTLAISLTFLSAASAHCEIPCGIYGDKMRIKMIEEDITTIEKSMKEISKLSKEKPVNYNQLVRWISNKDVHANKIQETVYQYFMAQRIKPSAEKGKALEKYLKEITLLHRIIIYSMKAKQTIDLANCTKLRDLLKEFSSSYFTSK
jgi:nickel superoxide dismutase